MGNLIDTDGLALYDEEYVQPIKDTIAPAETSPSTHDYDIDAQLFYNGVLYRVIDDIAIGDSLVVNTNIEESDDLVNQIKDIDSLTYNRFRRERKNISSELSDLVTAIAEQNLEKYGYSIGDYFESPVDRTLVLETYSNNTLSTKNVNVRLRYNLADLNTYYGGYNSYAVLNTPHIAIVVDTKIARQWHSGDVSSVGYNGSKLQSYLKGDVLNAIKADMKALFGGTTGLEHLLSHQKLFTTAFANWSWQTDQYISALTESEIYGHTECTANQYQEGEAVKPLELFQKFRWNEIYGNTWIWLRNMQAASLACNAAYYGLAGLDSVIYTGRASGLILFH